jgi:hypothetical protein
MALNFNLLNTELPGQIATGAMRGYQGAQDRATELAQRQQQSQLNALKIAEAQRTEQSQNALNKAYSQSVTPTGTTDYNKLIGSLAAGGVGEKIPAIQKAQTEQLTAQSAQQKAEIDLIDASLKQVRSFLDTIDPADPNAPALYRQWHRANHSHPVIGPVLASRGVTVEQSDAQIEQAIAQGPQAFADLINKSKMGTEKFMEMNKMTPEIQTMTNLGYPITQEGFEAYRQAQRPEQLSFEQRKELARAGRSPGSTVSINTQLPASEEAQKEFMKEMRQTFGALKQAPTVLENIEAAKKLIPAAKGFMGPGGEPLLKAASFLNNRLGTNIDTKGVENAEELRSRLFFGILDNLKKLDSQPTQQQQEALRVALGSIGTDPNALPRVLDAFGNSIRQKVDLYNEEATGAEARGVKFPYKPTIALPSRPSGARPASGNVVVTPDGRSHNFPTPEAAAQFKKAAGL